MEIDLRRFKTGQLVILIDDWTCQQNNELETIHKGAIFEIIYPYSYDSLTGVYNYNEAFVQTKSDQLGQWGIFLIPVKLLKKYGN